MGNRAETALGMRRLHGLAAASQGHVPPLADCTVAPSVGVGATYTSAIGRASAPRRLQVSCRALGSAPGASVLRAKTARLGRMIGMRAESSRLTALVYLDE